MGRATTLLKWQARAPCPIRRTDTRQAAPPRPRTTARWHRQQALRSRSSAWHGSWRGPRRRPGFEHSARLVLHLIRPALEKRVAHLARAIFGKVILDELRLGQIDAELR